MRPRLPVAIGLAFATLLALPLRAAGESAPIFLDGFFGDWTGGVEHQDPAGDDGTSGIDFGALDLANDGDYLFVRFELTVPVGLQETNNLELYLDTDMNAGTGFVVGGIGAELRWQFGARSGRFYRAGSSVQIFQDDIRLRELPSVTSPEFEIAIGRNVRPDGVNLLFTGPFDAGVDPRRGDERRLCPEHRHHAHLQLRLHTSVTARRRPRSGACSQRTCAW